MNENVKPKKSHKKKILVLTPILIVLITGSVLLVLWLSSEQTYATGTFRSTNAPETMEIRLNAGNPFTRGGEWTFIINEQTSNGTFRINSNHIKDFMPTMMTCLCMELLPYVPLVQTILQ